MLATWNGKRRCAPCVPMVHPRRFLRKFAATRINELTPARMTNTVRFVGCIFWNRSFLFTGNWCMPITTYCRGCRTVVSRQISIFEPFSQIDKSHGEVLRTILTLKYFVSWSKFVDVCYGLNRRISFFSVPLGPSTVILPLKDI